MLQRLPTLVQTLEDWWVHLWWLKSHTTALSRILNEPSQSVDIDRLDWRIYPTQFQFGTVNVQSNFIGHQVELEFHAMSMWLILLTSLLMIFCPTWTIVAKKWIWWVQYRKSTASAATARKFLRSIWWLWESDWKSRMSDSESEVIIFWWLPRPFMQDTVLLRPLQFREQSPKKCQNLIATQKLKHKHS